jgi:DNA polymerase-4
VIVSRRIKAILHSYTSVIEDVGLDEAFLDVTEARQQPEWIAQSIRRRIKAEMGLTCSVGVAPNKLLAKIGSGLGKPDGLTVITEDDIEPRVWPLPPHWIWGIGPKTEAQLFKMGVRTIGDLAEVPLETLIARFGKAHGHYFHQAARGIDDSAVVVERERKSIGHETTFAWDIDDRERLVGTLNRLADELIAEAEEQGLRPRTVTIKLRYADFETHTRQITLAEPTLAAGTIRAAAQACLNRLPLIKAVRLVGLRLSGFEREASERQSARHPPPSNQ